jgi:hypothetical protein
MSHHKPQAFDLGKRAAIQVSLNNFTYSNSFQEDLKLLGGLTKIFSQFAGAEMCLVGNRYKFG